MDKTWKMLSERATISDKANDIVRRLFVVTAGFKTEKFSHQEKEYISEGR